MKTPLFSISCRSDFPVYTDCCSRPHVTFSHPRFAWPLLHQLTSRRHHPITLQLRTICSIYTLSALRRFKRCNDM